MGTLGILLGTWIIHFVFEKEISPAQTCLGLSPQAQWLPPRPQIQYFWYSKSLLKAPQHLPPKELNSVSTQLCQRFLTVPSVLAKNKSHSSTWHPFRYPKMVLKTPRGAWFLPCWQNSLIHSCWSLHALSPPGLCLLHLCCADLNTVLQRWDHAWVSWGTCGKGFHSQGLGFFMHSIWESGQLLPWWELLLGWRVSKSKAGSAERSEMTITSLNPILPEGTTWTPHCLRL